MCESAIKDTFPGLRSTDDHSPYYIILCTPPPFGAEAECVGAITPTPFSACIGISGVELYLVL
jgi:hypothetical protein